MKWLSSLPSCQTSCECMRVLSVNYWSHNAADCQYSESPNILKAPTKLIVKHEKIWIYLLYFEVVGKVWSRFIAGHARHHSVPKPQFGSLHIVGQHFEFLSTSSSSSFLNYRYVEGWQWPREISASAGFPRTHLRRICIAVTHSCVSDPDRGEPSSHLPENNKKCSSYLFNLTSNFPIIIFLERHNFSLKCGPLLFVSNNCALYRESCWFQQLSWYSICIREEASPQ
jgi:hypothetical protein